MKNWGDKVFDGIPVAKDEAAHFSEYLGGQDFAAETRRAVIQDLRKFASWFTTANKEPFRARRRGRPTMIRPSWRFPPGIRHIRHSPPPVEALGGMPTPAYPATPEPCAGISPAKRLSAFRGKGDVGILRQNLMSGDRCRTLTPSMWTCCGCRGAT